MFILIDLDGTVRDVYSRYVQYARIIAPDIDWALPCTEYWFLNKYENHPKYKQLAQIWHKPTLFTGAFPYEGAVEKVKQIAQEHLVFLVTEPTPSDTAHSENFQWVKEWFGIAWAQYNLIQTPDRTIVNADILIDDNPEIFGIRIPTWTHILYYQPYNANIQKQSILSWKSEALF